MTNPREAHMPDKLASLKDTSARASGELAEKSFGLAVVWAAMQDAAQEGFSFVVMEPPKPLDMRRTAAWKTTAATLTEWGFKVEEVERPHRDAWAASWAMLVRWP